MVMDFSWLLFMVGGIYMALAILCLFTGFIIVKIALISLNSLRLQKRGAEKKTWRVMNFPTPSRH